MLIDLETLSLRDNARVTSIGAVLGVPSSRTYAEFESNINIDCVEQKDRHIDANTVKFWLEQSKEAQEALMSCPISTYTTLLMFNSFIELGSETLGFEKDKLLVFGNGSDFDNRILLDLYQSVRNIDDLYARNLQVPFTFRQNNDARMFFNFIKLLKEEGVEISRKEPAIKHHALSDAKSEYENVCAFIESQLS